MSINRVVLAGVFSFPHGDAAGARIRDLALGFKKNLHHVKIVSAFINNDEFAEVVLEGTKQIEGVEINYASILPLNKVKATSNFFDRLISRFHYLKLNKQLAARIVKELNGEEDELLFLYGRSYLFLNAVLKKIKRHQLKTKVVFDVVEPPRITTSKLEYLFHPFVIDSVLAFKLLLKEFHACTFISQKLKEQFGGQVQKAVIVPSFIYKKEQNFNKEIRKPEQGALKLGYLGALINKDYPSLMFQLCEELFEANINFELTLIGRFRSFAEGRNWEQKFKNSKFAHSIKFVSNPTEEEKQKVLERIDFLLMLREPSLLQEYTFPTRAPELLSYSKVLIVNGFGDFKLYFKDQQNAIIIGTETVKKDVKKIAKYCEPHSYECLVKNSQQLLQNEFNAIIQSKKISDLFA